MKRSGDRHRAGEVWVSLLSFYLIPGSVQNRGPIAPFLLSQLALDDHCLADEFGEGLFRKFSHIVRGESLRCIYCGGGSLWGGGSFRSGAGGFRFEREFLCMRVHVENLDLGCHGGFRFLSTLFAWLLRCTVGDGNRR